MRRPLPEAVDQAVAVERATSAAIAASHCLLPVDSGSEIVSANRSSLLREQIVAELDESPQRPVFATVEYSESDVGAALGISLIPGR
ncbi:hypothetical protein [Agromyces neolithicus]|uniref:ROK family protein n=1 Tax=Agromyces neolithicus TaxID=269420 RepID=A0ABN2M0Y8_9MICO